MQSVRTELHLVVKVSHFSAKEATEAEFLKHVPYTCTDFSTFTYAELTNMQNINSGLRF